MGTFLHFKVAGPADRADEARQAIEQAKKAVEAFVETVSSWDPRSDTGRINANAGKEPVRIDPRLMQLLLHARGVSEMSGGAFDITFSPLGRLWLLQAEKPIIPTDHLIDQTRDLVNYRDLIIDPQAGTALLRRPGMRIDLGAIAKGAAIDVAARSLKDSGFDNALIEAGGDFYAMGAKPAGPWILGIRNPRGRQHEILGKVPLRDRAIATSGDYEKMVVVDGKRHHHILDPRTGRPADTCISVTVVAPDAETADALSTALFVMGPKDGMALCERLSDVEALFVDTDFNISRSSGFPKLLERKDSP